MTVGPDGLIYVSAFNSNQVWRYNPVSGAFVDVFVPSVSTPSCIVFGTDGYLYVCSEGADSISKFDPVTGAYIATVVNEPGLQPISLAFGSDGKLYVGGQGSSFSNQVRRYLITGAFETIFASNGSLAVASSVAFGPDGNLYVGSSNTASVLRFNGTTGAFIDIFIPSGSGGLQTNITGILFLGTNQPTLTGSMNTPRHSHTATLLDNGWVLVTGGIIHDDAYPPSTVWTNTAELYNPQTGAWRYTGIGQQTVMNQARADHTATKLADGRVLVAGGSYAIRPNSAVGGFTGLFTDSVEIFDPATETFATVTPLIRARVGHAALRLNDGRILVGGGFEGGTSSAEIYNSAIDAWVLSQSNFGLGAGTTLSLLPNGKVLMTGGLSSNGVYLFDPGANSWKSMTASLSARSTATVLPNGKVLLAGGNDGSTVLPYAELYDTTVNAGNGGSVLVPGNQNIGGWNSSAATLSNGDVLLAGGNDFTRGGACPDSTANLQLFKLNSGSLVPQLPMNVPRSVFTATRLSSGQVLLAAGDNYVCGTPTILGSAELWAPGATGGGTGTINVSSNLPAATFSIVGPTTYMYLAGVARTVAASPVG